MYTETIRSQINYVRGFRQSSVVNMIERELDAIDQRMAELERQIVVKDEAIVRALAWARGESRLLWGDVEERLKAAFLSRPTSVAVLTLEQLREIEWGESGFSCPVCNQICPDSPCIEYASPDSIGHKDNCWLNAKIKHAST